MSWVTDNVTSSAVPYFWAEVVVRGETKEQYNTWDGSRNWQSRAELVKMAHDPPRYERRLCTASMGIDRAIGDALSGCFLDWRGSRRLA